MCIHFFAPSVCIYIYIHIYIHRSLKMVYCNVRRRYFGQSHRLTIKKNPTCQTYYASAFRRKEQTMYSRGTYSSVSIDTDQMSPKDPPEWVHPLPLFIWRWIQIHTPKRCLFLSLRRRKPFKISHASGYVLVRQDKHKMENSYTVNYALLGYFAARSGNSLPTFRDSL